MMDSMASTTSQQTAGKQDFRTGRTTTVNGHWRVEFQAGRGAPNSAVFKEPSDRSNNSNSGIQYFPGVATDTRKIDISVWALTSVAHIELNLGKVREMVKFARPLRPELSCLGEWIP